MLINFTNLYKKYDMRIKGIVHIGAHYGEEVQEYVDNGLQKITVFEPLSDNFDILSERLKDVNADIQGYQVALGSRTGTAIMNISSHGAQSSSILKPKQHLELHPEVSFTETEEVEVHVLDDYDLGDSNFINIDVQGYELEVFKGGKKTLEQIDYVYCEVNRDEVYEGNAMVEDLDEYLGQYGFERVETKWPETYYTWGDALYIKTKKGESEEVINYFDTIGEKVKSYNTNRLYEKPTKLCEIFTSYGSDKGDNHNYSTFYDHIFSSIKDEDLNFFELGLSIHNGDIALAPGCSLLGFRDYFSKAELYGADIDPNSLIHGHSRIKTYLTDQTNPLLIRDLWNEPDLDNVEFDIIIEDGLHEFYANKIFFENSIHKLKKGGIYIIEDIKNDEIRYFKEWMSTLNGYEYLELLTLQHPLRIHGAQVGSDDDILDNRLMVLVK